MDRPGSRSPRFSWWWRALNVAGTVDFAVNLPSRAAKTALGVATVVVPSAVAFFGWLRGLSPGLWILLFLLVLGCVAYLIPTIGEGVVWLRNRQLLAGAGVLDAHGRPWKVPHLSQRKRLTNLGVIVLFAISSIAIFFVEGEFRLLSGRDQTEEERFRFAVEALSSPTEQERGPGYFSLIRLLGSDDLSEASAQAILQGLALEEDSALRASVVKSIDETTLSGLTEAGRRNTVRLSTTLIKEVVESRRQSLVDILGVLLTGLHLSDADFSHLSLNGLRASRCGLRNSNFNGTSLHGVAFDGCDLSGSTFQFGSIDASFTRCNLSGAHFKPNLFRPSSFNKSNLTNVRLDHYSLAEYNFHYYPGWSKVGSFRGASMTGLTIANPRLLVVLPADGEMPQRLPGLLAGALHNQDPEDFRTGLTWGIRPPTGEAPNLGPSLVVPLESVLALAGKGDADFIQDLPYLRETIMQQFTGEEEGVFERPEIWEWLVTGAVNLR